MSPAEVEVRVGVDEHQRAQAAELYWEAFSRKLQKAIGPRDVGVELLAATLRPEQAVAACRDGEIVGLAGFDVDGAPFVDLGMRDVVRSVGMLRALVRLPWLLLLGRTPKSSDLHIDGIAVAAGARGGGIGSRLVAVIEQVAREHGATGVRLEVVDTNPDARRLYERLGYIEVRTEQTPYLRRAMGFGAATEMVKRFG